MANVDTIEVRTAEYRPCYVTEAVAYSEGVPVVKHERKALFHRWTDVPMVSPSKMLMVRDANDATEYVGLAIVEYEDGKVDRVFPEQVRFVPGLMNEYDFMEAVNETCDGID